MSLLGISLNLFSRQSRCSAHRISEMGPGSTLKKIMLEARRKELLGTNPMETVLAHDRHEGHALSQSRRRQDKERAK